jgi:hypothetical protein
LEGRRREQLWEGVKARATASRMSMTKPEEFERCAWYGELAEDGLEIEGLRACLPCAADEIFRRSDNRWSSKRTPVPQEQRFEALFDEHVFRGNGKALPQDGYISSAVNQLWRDVEKVQRWTRYADIQLFH